MEANHPAIPDKGDVFLLEGLFERLNLRAESAQIAGIAREELHAHGFATRIGKQPHDHLWLALDFVAIVAAGSQSVVLALEVRTGNIIEKLTIVLVGRLGVVQMPQFGLDCGLPGSNLGSVGVKMVFVE